MTVPSLVLSQVHPYRLLKLGCGHMMCCTCMTGMMTANINDGKIDGNQMACPLRAPVGTCEHTFGDTEIKSLLADVDILRSQEGQAGETLLAKYTRFARDKMVERNPNLRWCIRPGACMKLAH